MLHLNLRTKIFLAMALIALVVAGAMVGTTYQLRRAEILEEFQFVVRSIAGTAALAIDGNDVGRIRSGADVQTPQFQRVRAVLEHVRRINGLKENEIYILRPTDEAQFQTEFVVMLQEKTFVGDRYVIPEANRALVVRALQGSEPTASALYADEHGQWISGYAPVREKHGWPIAVVEVDADVGAYLARLRGELLTSLAVAGGAFLLAMVPGLILANTITRGVNRLARGIRQFQAGDHGVQVSVRAGDEISQLAGAFNDMIVSLAEKLALLPYVSRFTAEAVRRSRTDPSWLIGSEKEIVVLFADLRGFTRFSESRDPPKLIAELNQLLAMQAEAVLSSGGDVDKFVGDAVMAVFLDDDNGGRNAASKALACAKELMQRVQQYTSSHRWTLSLGIGIHCGRAVVGSVGSATRRDFTAIGHTVNLASRLCDRAAMWQIILSEELHEALPADERDCMVMNEPMVVRNISRPVVTYSTDCRTAELNVS